MMFMVNQKIGKTSGKLGHYAEGNKTLCGITLGVGSGLVRDGDYSNHRWCSVCSLRATTGERGAR